MNHPKLYTFWFQYGTFYTGIGTDEQDAYQNCKNAESILNPSNNLPPLSWMTVTRGPEVSQDFYNYIREREAKNAKLRNVHRLFREQGGKRCMDGARLAEQHGLTLDEWAGYYAFNRDASF